MADRPLSSTTVEAQDSLEAINDLMYRSRWTDGLPVIPPTEDRVLRMIDYVRRDPDEVIAYLDPEGGAATVEKVAINAVMAGCLPEYMPVLIAAVEALADEAFHLHGVQTTTNPVAPLLIVNGPIRQELEINSGRGAFGPCWRANATLGRAIRLMLLNIGGAWPGPVDQGVQGMPGKYGMCIGENEEESPWEPLHMERGLPPGSNAITVVGIQGTTNNLTAYKKPENILAMIADSMSNWGTNSILMGGGNPVVLLTPGHARLLHDAGWTKEMVKRFLWEKSKVHRSRLPQDEGTIMGLESGQVRDGDYLCVTHKPEDIVVVVVGGPEPYHATYCPSFGDTWAVTREVRLLG